jgi:D-lactate dehydrogenase
MGPARNDPDRIPLYLATLNVLRKGGYEVIFPDALDSLCCGMPFSSKGYTRQADEKARELEAGLLEASRNGIDPVLCDTSPCLYRMRRVMTADLRLYDPAGFVFELLMDRLVFRPQPSPVAVHHTCSAVKMALEAPMLEVARRCAPEVVVPDQVSCCGFAGDRGFTYPELNASALAALAPAVGLCSAGYSTSRTCEIGLSLHSGIFYKSIMYLVDRCTVA